MRIYRDGDPLREIPTLRMLAAEPEQLRLRSEELLRLLGRADGRVVPSQSYAGSGANPARPIPSHAVALPGGNAANDALRAVRPTSIFARVTDDHLLLDARTLLLEDLDEVAGYIGQALS